MPRTPKRRRICSFPDYYSFIPEDAEKEILETIMLSLDEFETIRLLDYEGLNQEDCAFRMGVARTTVTAMYENARKKKNQMSSGRFVWVVRITIKRYQK